MIAREYIRSILFGIEDSLVSTTGLVAGISVGAADRRFVLLAGIVAIAIEAISMGAGEFLSDDALQEIDKLKRTESPVVSGALMFISYLGAGLIPILPVAIFEFPRSVIWRLILACLGLYLLGYLKARLVGGRGGHSGLKMLIVG